MTQGYKGVEKAQNGHMITEDTFREQSTEYFESLLNVKKGRKFVIVEWRRRNE